MKLYLLLIGIGILWSGFLFLSIYLCIIDKQLNLIWELLRIRVQNSFFEIRENIEERLSQVHKKSECLNNNIDSSIFKNAKALTFRHSLRMIWKISIIFILAFVFSFIQYFTFEQNLQVSLKYHSILISSVMDRKVILTNLGFFVLESDISNTSSSLTSVFPFYNGLNSPSNSVINLYNEAIANLQGLESPVIRSLLSTTLLNYIFVSYPSNLTFLGKGTMSGVIYFLDESLYFAYNNVEDSYINYFQYFTEAVSLYDALDATAAMDSTDIAALINSQLDYLYYLTGGFGVLFLIMYCCYYYPMLSYDIKFLKKLTDLISILPKTKNIAQVASLTKQKIRFASFNKSNP